MLKILLPLLICGTLLIAEESNKIIEAKYEACEKSFDICTDICEETTTAYDKCISKCDDTLYKCNLKVENIIPIQEM